MIHMELGPNTIVGIGLASVGILLYFIRANKPGVSRDYDLFFSSVNLLCGGILIFQGWRLDPILLLCQLLSSGTAIFFIAESLFLRNNNSLKPSLVNSNEQTDLFIENRKQRYLKMNLNRFSNHCYKQIKLVTVSTYNVGLCYPNYCLSINYIGESKYNMVVQQYGSPTIKRDETIRF
jgi:hypothetical protein